MPRADPLAQLLRGSELSTVNIEEQTVKLASFSHFVKVEALIPRMVTTSKRFRRDSSLSIPLVYFVNFCSSAASISNTFLL